MFESGPMEYGYNLVTQLPINASSIVVTQTSDNSKPDENYLAIKDLKSSYLFNGKYIVMMYSFEHKLGNGVVVEFSGSDHESERVKIKGPIPEELIVEVLV